MNLSLEILVSSFSGSQPLTDGRKKSVNIQMLFSAEAYSETCQKSKMERFAKIVNGLKLPTVFVKRSRCLAGF